LDVNVLPGVEPNNQYWNCYFDFGAQIGGNVNADIDYVYQDIVEIMFDGYEKIN